MDAITTTAAVHALPSLTYAERGHLPESPGLYFVLTTDGEVGYVGMSTVSLRQRWNGPHHTADLQDRKPARIAFAVMECPPAELASRERAAIVALAPLWNISHSERDDLVASKQVEAELGIPAYALHRLVKRGVVPVHDVTPKGWPHQRRVLRFKLSEVRAALGEPPAPPRT